ncbi:MAG: integrase core domain-containing protein [Oligoflexales bacterium]
MIVEIKRQNSRFGCPQIVAIVLDRTGIKVGEETVRRILAKYFGKPPGNGPSWLTFLGHQADSLWSIDLFRVESILLRTHWVLVVMDQFSRKIVGFAACQGAVTGEALCYMFNRVIEGKHLPTYLSRDNDPLYKFDRWMTNIEMLGIREVRSIPYSPTSHPFIERAIGTTRREFLDQSLFWNLTDLEQKLKSYQRYYNESRVHQGIEGVTPESKYSGLEPLRATPSKMKWRKYCGGLFTVPKAA